MDKKLFFLPLILCFILVACQEFEEEKDQAKEDESEDSFDKENGVFVLNSNTFDSFLEAKEISIVEFYAPWCGHCQKLLPEYEKAAKELEGRPHLALAKVDATVEKELAERFEVSGYPTLIAFRKGAQLEYDGARDKEGIVAFMDKLSSPDWKPPKVHVLDLSTENFTDFVEHHDLSIVMFYAPWCGHCKKLKPEYEKAAKELQDKGLDIPLTKVDATIEKELATKYKVEGYPTMKVFRKGREFEFKSEAREKWGLVSYIEGLTSPASTPLSKLTDLKKELASSEDLVVLVAFFEKPDHAFFDTYLETANNFRDVIPFRHATDAKLASLLNLPSNCLALFSTDRFRTKHEPRHKFTDHTTADDISAFVKANLLPLMGEYVPERTEKHYKAQRPLVLFFYTVDWSFDHRDATQLWRHKFADIAHRHPSMRFAIADEDANRALFKQFGFDDSGEEINVGILAAGDMRYPMEPMEEYEADEVEAFLKKFNEGKLKPLVKSQPKPAKQAGPVITVVGKTFEEVVMDEKKDVLIELYAPWCGHCKELEPLYKQLAAKLKSERQLVVAKMDATANDSPLSYSAEGFPTIYFAPSGSKAAPLKFSGARTVEGLEKFVREHAVVAFKGGKQEL